MKKLLALILCVMMFVAIIPTNAFAATWPSKADSKEAITDANKAIKYMYNAIVADEGVFATVSAVDSFVSSFSKEMFSSIDGNVTLFGNVYTQDGLEKGLKAYLRDTIGDEINDYLVKHKGSFTTGANDRINKPDKYLEAFATAACKAISSEKAAKALQAVALDVMFANLTKTMADNKDDLIAKMVDWDSDYQDIYAAYGLNPDPLATGNTANRWATNYASDGVFVEPVNIFDDNIDATLTDVNAILAYYVP